MVSNQFNDLEAIDASKDSIPYFGLDGYTAKAKCIGIDSSGRLNLVFKLHGVFYRWDCCIRGVIIPSEKSIYTEERKRASDLKRKLIDKIHNRIIYIRCGTYDALRKCLFIEDMYKDEENIISWIIQNRYGYQAKSNTPRWYDMYLRENISNVFI